MDIGYSGVSPGESVLVSSGACKCTFLPSFSSSVTHPFAWKKGSVAFPRGFPTRLSKEAFPRGFPTGLSKMPPWCESILGLKSRQCRENRFPWNGLRHPGTLGMVARPWSSSRLSCGARLLLRCDGNTRNFIPTTQGKDPSSRARRRKRGSSGCGGDSRASSRVEMGISGNFLSCS